MGNLGMWHCCNRIWIGFGVCLCYILIISSLYFQQKQIEKGKIIIYTTSFSGVRGTHEDCKYILSLFYNHRVKVEERDVYMNQSYHRELDERLRGDDCTLPQVFINGEHIGVRFFIIYTPFFCMIIFSALCSIACT